MTEEERLQAASMRYIRLQYPGAVSFHVANERQTSPARGAKLKKLGVLKGVADILILEPSPQGFHGLAIELKSKKGKIQPSQELFLSRIGARGYYTTVCRSFDEVQKVCDQYFSGTIPM